MSNLKATVINATTNVTAVYELRNILKKDVYTTAFGDRANEVLAFNTMMGVASWIQLALDIKNKKDIKRIIGNQLFATTMVLGHNAIFSKDVRVSVNAYFNK